MTTRTIGGKQVSQQDTHDVMYRTSDVMPNAAIAAAARRGIPVQKIDAMPGLVEFGNGCHRRRMVEVVSDRPGTISMRLVIDKSATKFVLKRAGLPVPKGHCAANITEALAAANAIKYPVVLKPVDSSHTRGTYVDIQDDQELRNRFPEAIETSRSQRALIEEIIQGVQYRATIIDYDLVALYENRFAQVIGDGIHTIGELVARENLDSRRCGPPRSIYVPIPIDATSDELLQRAGLSIDHILDEGVEFRLHKFPLRGTGSTTIDCTDIVHPRNRGILEQAARIMSIPVATIDVITADINRPIWEDGGAIIEINCESVLSTGYTLFEGPVYDFGAMHVEMFFPAHQKGRVPVIAVVESPNSVALCHSIADTVQAIEASIGISSRNGVSIDSMYYSHLDVAGLDGLPVLLNNPKVEIAIVEISQNDLRMIPSRLDYCDLAVIPQLSGDTTSTGQPIETTLCDLVASGGGQIMLNSNDIVARTFGARYLTETVTFEYIA